MIVIDLDADLNLEDDEGFNLARVPAGGAPEPGAVLVAGRGDFWSWAVVQDVDEGFVRFQQISAKEAVARRGSLLAAS